MNSVVLALTFVGTAIAHSAVSSVKFDGTIYPARNAQYDRPLGAKRVEWNFKDLAGFPWLAINDVLDPAITCGLQSSPPELKAVARAGSNITVQWTGVIRMHLGPVLSYLGAWQPGMKAQDIDFFKISEDGYDKTRQKWANEDLIERNTADTFQIPSNIKSGTYVLRTELLALHGNTFSSKPVNGGGPQFYTHCFNVEITGGGNETPQNTVKFPGGYTREDPGVAFNLKNKAAWESYVIPGPPVYKGKRDPPTGAPGIVAAKDTGAFPASIDEKYQKFKKDADVWATKSHTFFNNLPALRQFPDDLISGAGVKETRDILGKSANFFQQQFAEAKELIRVRDEIKKDLVKVGYLPA